MGYPVMKIHPTVSMLALFLVATSCLKGEGGAGSGSTKTQTQQNETVEQIVTGIPYVTEVQIPIETIPSYVTLDSVEKSKLTGKKVALTLSSRDLEIRNSVDVVLERCTVPNAFFEFWLTVYSERLCIRRPAVATACKVVTYPRMTIQNTRNTIFLHSIQTECSKERVTFCNQQTDEAMTASLKAVFESSDWKKCIRDL